ncbi:hypothetical protein AJ80_05905 [Polytolypa hystricis UAMH7299]|uniref:Nephrocystin 3-like N-terminal domain-containing protein n=1 Tax=Polytolypa hystricis (strain UAMH7299) TaxID=1447883 RepID=A0A2B7XZK9_POLH7|nr:hypothetical protein AJ80_05905 [Polytolypa hystricis UAMH7299]
MYKALKEEHVPSSWTGWREKDHSSHSRDKHESSIPPPVDIIAVQGLASTYERTWSKERNDGSSVMWLRDLLPVDLEEARIMTFEYDSKWLEDPSYVSLRDCGERLLRSILYDRTHRGEETMCPIMARRPLILIGHSFGGLVIKQALVSAAKELQSHPKYEDYQSLITSIAGVVFLGTPHNGSKLASYGTIQANIRSWLGGPSNPEILAPLILESTTSLVGGLMTDFQNIQQGDRLSGLLAYYFYETKPLTIGRWNVMRVVDEDSACYGADPHFCIPLEADHKNMNKFGSRDESNYLEVKNCLVAIHSKARSIVDQRWGNYQYSSHCPDGKVKEIQDWLSPVPFLEYENLQAHRLEGTCEWVFDMDIVKMWLNPQPSDPKTVWISGKAGSGKSIITTYLYDHISAIVDQENWSPTDPSRCSGMPDSISCKHYSMLDNQAVLYFPFKRDRTIASAIRTLIDQILRFQPLNSNLQEIVLEFKRAGNKGVATRGGFYVLMRLLKAFPLTYIIIDGIDECDEASALLELLHPLSGLPQVRLMLIGRRDEIILDNMNEFFDSALLLDVSQHNGNDISLFIAQKVNLIADVNPVISPDKELIVEFVSMESRGMFQWVKLILDPLKHAKTEKDIWSALREFPNDLDEAYTKTFQRLSKLPGFKRNKVTVVLSILSSAYRPLTLQELGVAVEIQERIARKSSGEPEDGSPNIEDWLGSAIEEGKTLPEGYFSFLGPLVDIFDFSGAQSTRKQYSHASGPSVSGTITICHFSLSQWLTKTSSNADYMSEFRFTETDAHLQASRVCLAMLSSKVQLLNYFQGMYTPQLTSVPFANYAGEYGARHVRAVGGWENTLSSRNNILHDLGILYFATASLEHSIDLALVICSALSTQLNQINVRFVNQLQLVIAIRDLKNALFIASNNTSALKYALPQLSESLHGLSTDPGFQRYLRRFNLDPSTPVSTDTAQPSLNAELDSTMMTRVLAFLEQESCSEQGNNSEWMDKVNSVCKALRSLRMLTIFLAVDPVRTWLYSQTGTQGISPIAALAHIADTIDTHLAVFLLPRKLVSQHDFRGTFEVEQSHPFYGPITSTRHELKERDAKGLGPTFYKDHILIHYAMSLWEWRATKFMLAAMEFDAHDGFSMNLFSVSWLTGPLRGAVAFREGDSGSYVDPAVEMFNRTSVKTSPSPSMRVKEILWLASRTILMFIFKYLTHVCPQLEYLFLDVTMTGRHILSMLLPVIKLMLENRPQLLLSFVLYILRVFFAPWVYRFFPYQPWKDLIGIINDPTEYQSPTRNTGWSSLSLSIAQELLFCGMSLRDIFYLYDRARQPSEASQRQPPVDNRASPNPKSKISQTATSIFSNLLLIPVNFHRIVFVERTLLFSVHILYTLIQCSAFLVRNYKWSWKSMFGFGTQLLGYTTGRTLSLVDSLSLYVRIWLVSKLLNRYNPRSLFSLLFDYVIMPIPRWCWRKMHDPVTVLVLVWQSCTDMLYTSVQGMKEPGMIRTTIFCVAGLIVCIALLFTSMMRDSLRLAQAKRSCAKAGEIAAKATGIEDASLYLRWSAVKGVDGERLPTVSKYELLDT